ncbi:tubulin--tyrosine ligase family protein [Hoeflea sp. G2-23]|uniref:Tubulin--tyrosine ligase family protein n=1 Tax=Hoeflea algicola TaxID=2983763 RepID=A0ABT3Z4R0_9HYPH|nr:hypothetical protein [Hoeflea algicola]MCY0146374.1 tubulin--tyrosine ligase family protein [Hoeflea algicola]
MLTPASNANCCATTAVAEINRSCHCLPFDAAVRRDRVSSGSHNPRLPGLLADRPGLYAGTAVFLARDHYLQMAQLVEAVAHSTETNSYEVAIHARDPGIDLTCQQESQGLLMGFDFHVSADGPRLIEINTNAGAAFLAKQFAEPGSSCLPVGTNRPDFTESRLDDLLVSMFLDEWNTLRRGEQLGTLAIVDENPENQYLYPDMLLAAELLNSRGIRTLIVDPSALTYRDGALRHDGETIDMVYNRLTDFKLEADSSRALQQAYLEDGAVISPSPRHHALYADKRNLVLLGGADGTPGAVEADLRVMIPLTQTVGLIDPAAAWKARKSKFFKPAGGFGSRAAYRGDKLTTGVWKTILNGDYVAQQYVAPADRGLLVDGVPVRLKFDIRLYAYAGKPLFPVARMYSGQTTNFRTSGGGLAPVILV